MRELSFVAETQTADLAFMRERNAQIVLNFLREEGPISRAELARRTHLSRSTVSNIIAALLAEQVVFETGIGSSQGGRKPVMLEFNYRSSLVAGIDVASSMLTVLLTDLQATVLQRANVAFDLTNGPSVGIAQIAELFFTVLRAANIDPLQISGIGIGVPGPLSNATGQTIAPPVMPGWHDVPLQRLLQRALGRPVLLDNDANLGALAEHTLGAARGQQNVAYVYFGTLGIGGGLILDGQLYRGQLGSAGEIGHLMLAEDGPRCRCGSVGCLEAYAGIPALLARAAQRGLVVATPAELVALAQAGNVVAEQIIAEAGTYLGMAIANLLSLLNPGSVVIGGALAEAGELLLGPLRATLVRRGLIDASQHIQLRPGELGEQVVALGAAALAIQHVLGHARSTDTSLRVHTPTVSRYDARLSAP